MSDQNKITPERLKSLGEATSLLTRLTARRSLGDHVVKRTETLRWPDHTVGVYIGMPLEQVQQLYANELVDCRAVARGYVQPDSTIIAPIRQLDRRISRLYHVTPLDNWNDSIKRNGILAGAVAGRTTTGRVDCSDVIHVCLNESDAREWPTRIYGTWDQLRYDDAGPGVDWYLLTIDATEIQAADLIRDPASNNGWLFRGDSVPRSWILSKTPVSVSLQTSAARKPSKV